MQGSAITRCVGAGERTQGVACWGKLLLYQCRIEACQLLRKCQEVPPESVADGDALRGAEAGQQMLMAACREMRPCSPHAWRPVESDLSRGGSTSSLVLVCATSRC